MMGQPNRFAIEGERGFFRPVGAMSLDQAVSAVDAAFAFARDKGLREVLVDITAVTGFEPPGMFDRFLAACKWAETVGGRLRVVMVAREELIHPQKFGVTVARNRGMDSNIFPEEAEAVAWLESHGA
jgi:hypothetical protein